MYIAIYSCVILSESVPYSYCVPLLVLQEWLGCLNTMVLSCHVVAFLRTHLDFTLATQNFRYDPIFNRFYLMV